MWYVYYFKNHQIVFQSDCAILKSLVQCLRVPVSPHPRHYSFYLSWLIGGDSFIAVDTSNFIKMYVLRVISIK